jgi:LPXTG-site transpeptidase (sortase) family protein
MKKSVNKRNVGIIIGVLILFIGVCILGSTYYNTKKNEVFDDMNELYYEQVISMDEEVDELTETPTSKVVTTSGEATTTKSYVVDYTQYYIGYLSIPKINFKRGFLDKDNKYNNVNRNLYVLPSSNYPDVENGNLIIAGHSGSTSVSFFNTLYKLSVDDDLYIDYKGLNYHYKIKKIYTDKKDGDITIYRNKKKTTLTLITCTKGDHTTQTIYICELV